MEYTNFDAFEIDAIIATARAYNLGFDDCKKVVNPFPSLDLHQITPTGKPEDKGKGEEPAQIVNGDDANEEVV